jgi:pimeloyl-ACP methyl ester carboxylesterase
MLSSLGDHLALVSLRAALAVFGQGGSDRAFRHDARAVAAELARLRATPAPLPRPVVILSGYHTPVQVAWWVRVQLTRLTSGNPGDFMTVSYPTRTRIEQAAEQSIAAVRNRWREPRDVDAVGISMGGLVARYAALAPERRTHPARPTQVSDDRLRVSRLFTFATPHQGSIRAQKVAPDDAARDMKPGSPFLAALNAHQRDYPVVSYVHRGDNFVVPEAAAPPGQAAFTADGSRLMSHFTTAHNPWFLVDIARRLRGEPPLLEG